jgi:hypothetical protein
MLEDLSGKHRMSEEAEHYYKSFEKEISYTDLPLKRRKFHLTG